MTMEDNNEGKFTPLDMNLPPKFTEWRDGQLEITAKIAVSQKPLFMLDAPTGSGKSLIAAGVQRILAQNVLYLCTTKQLQDQLLADFPYARTLKGRGNYVCLKYPKMYPTVSAEECTHTDSKPCGHISMCPYKLAKDAALRAPLAVLNTAYYLSEVNFVGTFAGYPLVIMDEFDTIEDMLMSFIEVRITQRQLDSIGLNAPKYKTKFESWVEWATAAIKILKRMEADIEIQKKSVWGVDEFKLMRDGNRISRLIGKLVFFSREVDKNWEWYPGETEWAFKPVWVSKYANDHLWKYSKRVLGMSATILDPFQMCRNIGVDFNTCTYKQLPSRFPKENRPVYYEPCAKVIHAEMQTALPKIAKKVQEIMTKHPDEKILVHCVSYKVKQFLMRTLDPSRTISHESNNRTEILDLYKRSQKPLVLISPSMDRGVDLPGDLCRAVVIVKLPYPDLSDPQIKHRVYGSKDGNTWYAHKTIGKVIQMAGRGVRSADDYAATYIIDEKFGDIYKEHRRMFPLWFQEAVIM